MEMKYLDRLEKILLQMERKAISRNTHPVQLHEALECLEKARMSMQDLQEELTDLRRLLKLEG
jgi:predicted  nucleic acid-binding Zn-ribbon protein